jgi:hypothetical protein
MKNSTLFVATGFSSLLLVGVPIGFQQITTTSVNSAMTCSFDLTSNEGGTNKGHTIERHVNQSDSQLKLRLTNNPDLEAVSTYASLAQAQSLTDSTICSDQPKMTTLVNSGKDGDKVVFTKTFSSVTGTVMKADGKTKVNAYGVVVVVKKNSAMAGKIAIVTSYPE